MRDICSGASSSMRPSKRTSQPEAREDVTTKLTKARIPEESGLHKLHIVCSEVRCASYQAQSPSLLIRSRSVEHTILSR